ncbi:MAG: zinc-binding dehydrogenase [Gemmatimonadota bacterium]
MMVSHGNASGPVGPIDRSVPLERAAEAHSALEERQTSGKVLLIP